MRHGEKLSTDILIGAAAISEFLLGDASERRRIYHLAAKNELPCFRLGAVLCARKSTLLDWIKSRELAAAS